MAKDRETDRRSVAAMARTPEHREVSACPGTAYNIRSQFQDTGQFVSRRFF